MFRAVKFDMKIYEEENKGKTVQQKELFMISILQKGYTPIYVKRSKGIFLDVMVDFNDFSLF